MEDASRDTAAELERMKCALEALEARVRRLEKAPRAAGPATAELDISEEELAELKIPAGLASVPAFVGRLLLVLGGAYLLRSFTESKALAPTLGAGLGYVYGLVWLGMAERAGRAGRRPAAAWHGIGAALIVFPLLWEATGRLGIFSPPVAALLLVVAAGAALLIAWRQRVPGLATLFVCGACVAGVAILLPDAAALPTLVPALVLIGVASLWIGRQRGWHGAYWTSAAIADLAVFLVAYRALTGTGLAPGPSLALLLGAFLAYTGSMAAYGLLGWKRLGAFEILQTAAMLAIGFGGALRVASHADYGVMGLGVGALVGAIALYLVAFAVVDRARHRCFYYLTTIALVLVVAGTGSLFPLPGLPWAVLAVAIALVAYWFRRATLGMHAAIYAAAATVMSGLVAWAARSWLGSAEGTLPDLSAWIALAAVAVVALVRVPARGGVAVDWREVPQALVLTLLVVVGGGVWLALVAKLAPSAADGPDPAWWAAARTGALAVLAVASAWLARFPLLRVLGRLVPVLLAAGAVKLLAEDLPSGRAASLALSFALYGAALLVAPRLAKATLQPAESVVDPGGTELQAES